MEVVAVNRFTVTRELFAESHAAVFSRQRQKMLLYSGLVFFAFGLASLALRARFPMASVLCVPLLLTGAFVVLWALTLERSELRRKYKAFRARGGESCGRTITCYRNLLTVETGEGEPREIDYPDIREHRQTEHLYLLICADHTGVMLAKDGFTEGNWQDLLRAIERAKEEAEKQRMLEAI